VFTACQMTTHRCRAVEHSRVSRRRTLAGVGSPAGVLIPSKAQSLLMLLHFARSGVDVNRLFSQDTLLATSVNFYLLPKF
jgi:hypothetical protein